MNRLRTLIESHWAAKSSSMLDGPYRTGANRRVEGAARCLLGGERLLDLGCGAGVLAQVLGSRYGEIHGLDLSAGAVAAAAHRGMRAQTWDLNDAPLPYPAEYFDAVTALSVLQYVLDPVALVREAARVVRPGGQVCLGCPNLRAMWRLVRLALLGRFPRVTRDAGYDGGTLHYFCRRDVEGLLTDAGLEVEASVGIFSWPGWLEARGDSVPIFSGLKREFLSGEVLVVGRKRLAHS